jgi:ubiquinone/menaquinone biosynthesis C-methylase UbiE
MESLREQLDLGPTHSLLEVGCAAGFLAKGLAAMCGRYTGVDLAPVAVESARRLAIGNAAFQVADATELPFADGSFDRVICHDVFTNFDSFELPRRILAEMARVVRPGGRMLVGSVPDDATKEEFQQRVYAVANELDAKYGPVPPPPRHRGNFLTSIRHWYLRRFKKVTPQIVCYYFRREDFADFGRAAGLTTRFEEIHAENPYRGYRFNVVYSRAA